MSDIVGQVARYYTSRVEEHGPSARGVDWNGPESQELRFEQLMKVAEGAQPGYTLLDYGSGYGALAEWLEARGERFSYTGFDVSDAMLGHASERIGDRTDRRFTGDESELEPADFVVASGVFNVKLGTSDEDWHEYVVGIVERLGRLARQGLAFNMLTSYSDEDKKRPDLHYADPLAWFDWCKRNLSRHVALLHDYGLWEFTIIVRLEPAEGEPQ